MNNAPNSDLARRAHEVLAAAAGQGIAHARHGAELTETVNVYTCPDAVVRFVPAVEEQAGVFI